MTQILPEEPGRTHILAAPEGLDARIVGDEAAEGDSGRHGERFEGPEEAEVRLV